MTGFADFVEKNILDAVVASRGLMDGSSAGGYIGLLADLSGTPVAGKEPNDDGTMPSGLAEPTTGGYARKAVAVADWAAAAGTSPATKQLPKSGGAAITWTATGAGFGNLTAWAYFAASSGGVPIISGPLTDGAGNKVVVPVNVNESYSFDENNPCIVRQGDPAAGTVPT